VELKLAAPKSKAAGRRKQLAAALPPAFYFHLEEVAAAPEASIVRVFARSMILCAWLVIRVQDMQRTKFFLDEDDPAHVVRGVVTCSKSGEPIKLFMPAKAKGKGVLGDFLLLQEHVALLEGTSLENEKGGGHRLPRLGWPVGLPLEPRGG
jgi:hypothetical protein